MIPFEEPRLERIWIAPSRRSAGFTGFVYGALAFLVGSLAPGAEDEAWEYTNEEDGVITAVFPSQPPDVDVGRGEIPDGFLRATPASMDELREMEVRMRKIVERVGPAVVALRIGGAHGSGVVVSEDGLVLTAAHVSGQPGRTVRLTFPDGREVEGLTLGADEGMDSGMIRITDEGSWPYADMGAAGSARLGDWVLAFGHPGGFSADRPTVVRLGRLVGWDHELLRTDSTIISGDSGGPLFDMNGRVIGIHSRISTSLAANYHVPIGTYGESWDRLVSGETWGGEESRRRSWVGASVADHPEGFRVERVAANGPAFRAGLEPGDVVVAINGEAIKDASAFMDALSSARPGEVVVLDVRRADQEFLAELLVQPVPRREWGGAGRR